MTATNERILGAVLWALNTQSDSVSDGGCDLSDDLKREMEEAAYEGGARECPECGTWLVPGALCHICMELQAADELAGIARMAGRLLHTT